MDLDKGKANISLIIESFSSDLSKMRSGKASLDMVESVNVEAYEAQMPISHVATISIPDAKTIVIQPWDKNLLKNIEKALMSSDLGLNPVVDGDIIRLSVPSLTQELREKYVKEMRERMEQAKVSVRGVRHKMMKEIDGQDKSGITEDDIKRQKNEVEEEVKNSVEKIEAIADEKEKELMSV